MMLQISDAVPPTSVVLPEPQRLLHITHARQDEAWVRGVVIPALGLADGQYWTRAEDNLEAPQLEELERAVQSCRYTLLVASTAARVDEWTTFAGILAQHLGIEQGKPRLLVLTRDFEPGSERARELLPLRHRCLVCLDCSAPERSAAALATLGAQLALTTTEEPSTECPYPGLRMFGAGDSGSCFHRIDLFFGREDEGHEIVDKLRNDGRVLLVGPSGCGKSSLVRARVLPALSTGVDAMAIAVVRPGAHPDISLRTALDTLDPRLVSITDAYIASNDEAGANAMMAFTATGDRQLVYIDQLEEAFLDDDSPDRHHERAQFLARLLILGRIPNVAILLSMRADFYSDLMRSSTWDEFKDFRVELAPLRGDALRLAITRPAEVVGVHVEVDLVERLVREAEFDRAAEALPLLQVALEQLWAHREWRYLSLASYERIAEGKRRGLDVVLARHADASMDVLDKSTAVLARRVLIDLVHLGEGRPDTRRRRSVSELCRAGDEAHVLPQVLCHLLIHRLISVGAEPRMRDENQISTPSSDSDLDVAERYVDLAHDALITGWPALAEWISGRRDDLRTQRRLEARAASGGLLAASELSEFTRWVAWIDTPIGQELGASETLRILVRQSILARKRRLAALFTFIAMLVVVAGIAFWQRDIAVTNATLADDNAKLAGRHARDADLANKAAQEQSRRANSRGNELLLTHARSELDRDPASAIAWLKHYPEDGDDWAGVQTLAIELSMHAIARHIWRDYPKYVNALVVSPNGHVVATGSGNLCALWDTHSGRAILKFKVPPVAQLAFSSDGDELAIGGTDGTIVVISVANKTMRTLGRTVAYVNALLVAPDGSIVTGDATGALQRWPIDGSPSHKLLQLSSGVYSAALVDRGTAIAVLGTTDFILRRVPLDGSAPSLVIDAHALAPHDADITSIAIGSAGRSLAIGMGDRVLRWDEGKPAPIELGRHRAPIKVVVMSLVGDVVSGAEDGSITSWSSNGPPRQLRGHVHAITSIAIDRDGERIASGDTSGEVYVWTSGGGELLRGHNGRIQEIAFGPEHLVFSSSADKTVRAWLPTHAPTITIPTGIGSVFGLAFLSSTTIVATQEDRSVQLVSLVTGKSREIKRYGRQAYGLQLLPGKRFATSSWDGSVTVFGADSNEILRFDHGAEINCLAASLDGTYLATTGTDGATWLWSISVGTGQPLERRSSETQDVAFSPDGRVLVSSGADFELHVFDLTGRTAPRTLRGHTGVARSLTFSRDGHMLYSAGGDGTVRVWNLDPGGPESPIRTLYGHNGETRTISLSSDQRYLASGGFDGIIIVWDLFDDYHVHYLHGHTASVPHITFLAGSHLLASAGWDGTVRLWNLDDGSITGWHADEDRVQRVGFSPDGKFLVSGGADGTVRIWSIIDQQFIPGKYDALTRWMLEATTALVHEPPVAHGEEVATPP